MQFETIHPFWDGNGRLGRLLIILLLCEKGMLDEPILYLSLFLKENRTTYCALLQEVRLQGRWETWLEFFLEGVYVSAKQAIATAEQITILFEQDKQKVAKLGRARFSCEEILEYMKHLPQVTIPLLTQELTISAPTARSSLNHLLRLGIIEQISGKKRNKIYIYRKYLSLLEEGTEPVAADLQR